jgi:choline kinase
MKAVILAAGVGRRLHTLTQHHPKCLIPIGGKTLLVRYLEALEQVGVSQVTIVVGYKHELIREAVASWSGSLPVNFLVNAEYERGSIISLWVARDALDDDTVIMDADVLFHPTILQKLVDSSHPNALLMDESVIQDPETREECMVVVQDGRVIALSKQMPETYDEAGEGVGFLRLSGQDAPKLLKSVEQRMTQGLLDMEYEDALRAFFQSTPVGVEKIGGLSWTEIDFPEDVVHAQNDVLPKLSEHDRD